MGKFFVRITVLYTTIYFIRTFISAWYGAETFNDAYIILFEICLCIIISSQGKYHCRYIRYTSYALTLCDTLTRLDNVYHFMPEESCILMALFLYSAIVIPLCLSLQHYYEVQRLNHKRNDIHIGRTE